MKLLLQRRASANGCTLGQLGINGTHQCYTLEDVVRSGPKIAGQTAIPAGTYAVRLTWSPRFGRILPLIEAVPGFEGVRIHPGNTQHDTEGCILVGRGFLPDRVTQSALAFDALFARLLAVHEAKEPITIEIRNAAVREPMA
jgi:hypothetical protein